ncbi:acyltransferase [Kitasatospora sp. NBC_01250]|uniref:acyltransferase family protein n=1 Tax=Kitasatospora sp. NBC_01250 TaxID=2903571 RepID=UPI002E36F16A|nr:acyltransferase [Kitasatospora sp. NBC_01250]
MPLSVLSSRWRFPSLISAPPAAGASPGTGPGHTRLYVLDGLRLGAALSVLLFHYVGKPVGWEQAWRGAPDKLLPGVHAVALYGWLGVELFFLISGFVICMSCWGKRPRDFLVSRLIRLYPAYWVAVLITSVVVVAAGYPFSTVKDITARTVLINLTMLQQPYGATAIDPSYWTLWVEMLFYLLFAVVVAMGLTYRRVVAFCGIWTFAAAIAPSVGLPLLDTLTQPAYAPLFVAGVTIYLMHRFGANLLLWGLLGFSWLAAQYRLEGSVQMYQQWLPEHISWSRSVAVMTCCFLLVLGAALGAFDWIQWRWLTLAGALTYPVYLLHQEVGLTMIGWLRQRLAPAPTLAMVTVGVLVLAWLVHRLVERPLSRVLKRGLTVSFESFATDDGDLLARAGRVRSTP